MTTTTIQTVALRGTEATLVPVSVTHETMIEETAGPGRMIVYGLPETAVRECAVRVRASLQAAGYAPRSVSVDVGSRRPAGSHVGTGVDLPIALTMVPGLSDRCAGVVAIGELSLGGDVRPVRGIFPIVEAAVRSLPEYGAILVPWANRHEAHAAAAHVPRDEHGGAVLVPVRTLSEAIGYLRGAWSGAWVPESYTGAPSPPSHVAPVDFSEIRGQSAARRALEIAAAGGFNVALVGPPGSGKSMLARRFGTILPAMTPAERADLARVRSVAGLLRPDEDPMREDTPRPFRAPHHTVSDVALIGGGSVPRPGEVSLAHAGVLFIDEAPEFRRAVVECLTASAGPMQTGEVRICRGSAPEPVRFPARFTTIIAANPCPCGHHGSEIHECRCTDEERARYLGRITGLASTCEIAVKVAPVPFDTYRNAAPGESSAEIRARVVRARAILEEIGEDGPPPRSLPGAWVFATPIVRRVALAVMALDGRHTPKTSDVQEAKMLTRRVREL